MHLEDGQMKIIETNDYESWYLDLTIKEQAKVMKRLNNIKNHDHLGDVTALGNQLYELRWKNGWRVYFIRIKDTMILLVGGHKNEQEKNIKQARIIVARYSRS